MIGGARGENNAGDGGGRIFEREGEDEGTDEVDSMDR